MCTGTARPVERDHRQRARDFLTQRAVQQTMFCSRVLRDETTVRWLEEWLGHHGLDDLHHCDALKVPSEQYWTSLLEAPAENYEIKKPIPGRTTRKNPYIKRRYFTYEVEIVPRMLARRILAARRQISDELQIDIPCIRKENNRSMELYRYSIVNPTKVDEYLSLPSNGDTRGSPYRQANFDLVKNYTLLLGLVDTVNELSRNIRTEEDADWLRSFLNTHKAELIAPYASTFGRADHIIEQLLRMTPLIRRGKALFDPGLLADIILEKRALCADEWLHVMNEASVEHLELERRILEHSIRSSP
ncbi:unnamed protein product [Agarophyton chilense]